MTYLRFVRRHPTLLSFGLLLTLFSSFGQTFLISIFVPRILTDFALSSGHFGTLYATATLCSALSLPYFGRLLDRTHLGRYSLSVGVALVLACWILAAAPNVAVLFIGVLGLRLAGQGLLGLTAATAMVRLFSIDHRGKALSIASAGYPLGEGILPIFLVLMLHRYGWRTSWVALGIFIAVVFLPLLFALTRGFPEGAPPECGPAIRDRRASSSIMRDWPFYLFLPGALTVPFVLTGIFLYQLNLAETRGWEPALMASGFIGFALTRMCCSIAIGHWVDRLGADRLFPFFLLPLALGLLVLHTQTTPAAVYAFFVLAGISQGVSGVVLNALWAQRYGVSMLGRIKGIVSMLAVFGTAGSPLLFGWLLAVHIGFERILPMSFVLCMGSTVTSLAAQRVCFPRKILSSPAVDPLP